jgi:tetratricopeptide (TPR) repeat protein
VNLGHTLRKLRQWEAAVDCYLQALGLKPGQVRCHLTPAISGQQSWGRCKAVAVPVSRPHCVQVLCATQVCSAGCGQCSRMVPMLCATILSCCVQAGTYSALGYTYHLKGDLDKAIEHYHKVRLLSCWVAGCGCWVWNAESCAGSAQACVAPHHRFCGCPSRQ